MKNMCEQNSSFLPESKFQFAWDSVSISAFKTCARFYQYALIEGQEPKHMPPALAFGISFHSLMEHYHNEAALGLSHEDALDSTLILAGTLGDTLPDRDTSRTPITLARALIWYFAQWYPDPAKTVILENGRAAVELSFTFELFQHEGTPIYLAGHMDRLCTIGEETYVADYKTSKGALNQRFFDGFSPGNQVSLYTFASQVVFNEPAAGLIIDGIQMGVNFCRFKRQPITRTASQLDEWVRGIQFLVAQAAAYAEADFYPQNDEACSKYGGCRYREICSKSPAVRNNFLKTNFTQRVWDPLKPRGEEEKVEKI